MDESLEVIDLSDHAAASILPLVCLAWSDGALDANEIGRLQHHLSRVSGLTSEGADQIQRWLNPNRPPDAAQYEAWLNSIRQAADHLPKESLSSIAALGIAFADLHNPNVPESQRKTTATALDEVEDALGLNVAEALSEVLLRKRAPKVADAASNSGVVDAQKLGNWLDAEYADHKNSVRELLRTSDFARYSGHDFHAYRKQVTQWTRLLGEKGLGSSAFPKDVGGEADVGKFMATFEMLAYHDLSLTIKFGVQFGLFGGSVQQLGSTKHHQQYLRQIGSMELPGCFAMSELGHGSNVREVETTATYDTDRKGYVIDTPFMSSRKEWIGNAAVDGLLATVFAQLTIDAVEYGVHAFLVPIRSAEGDVLPGVRIEDCGHKMGLNGIDNGKISFDSVFVDSDALLDRFASVSGAGEYSSPIPSSGKRFFTMLGTLVGGRISVGFGALSAAKTGLAIAVRYANRRRQFGPKNEPEVRLLDYLTHQRRLLPPLATSYALDIALSDLRRQFSESKEDTDQEVIETLAGGLKAYSTWHTTETLQTARESCGGQGFLTINRFATLKEDTDVFTTFEGDNTVLMLQVAKSRLSVYKQQFQDMNFFGMLKYLGDQATQRFADSNPIVARKTDSEHLRSTWFHRNALGYRSEKLLRSVARRLKGRMDRGMSTYDAFIECQDHLITMAEAFVEDHLVRSFRRRILETQDPEIAHTLRQVYTLFALSVIENRRGWFLEQDYISGGKSKAIRTEVNLLCSEMRPHAEALVDAFLIPDELLSAPIAFDGMPA